MKKIILGIAALSLLTLNSCDGTTATSTMNYPVITYNLVVSNNTDADPIVNSPRYTFNYDLVAQTVNIGGELTLSTSGTTTFTSGNIGYTAGLYQLTEEASEDVLISSGEIISLKADEAGTTNTSLAVTDFNCMLTPFAYIPPAITGIQSVTCPYGYEYAVMSYNLGDQYSVRTFWTDVTFKGSTTTRYPYQGENKTYTNKDVLYRIIMDTENKKATAVIYNVKLAEEMPDNISNIMLKDLDLKFDNSGYTISGENVVPEQYEAGVATPNTKFIFNNFTLRSDGDLTSSSISYTVADVYVGNFNGSYILQLSDLN